MVSVLLFSSVVSVNICVCLNILAYLLLIYSGMESDDEFSDQTLPTPICGSEEHDEAGQVKFEEMSVSDVESFLTRNKIPAEFCEKFRGQSKASLYLVDMIQRRRKIFYHGGGTTISHN